MHEMGDQLTKVHSQKMSKKYSDIKRQNVLFNYSYILPQQTQGEDAAKVYFSGQQNNWDLSEMTQDPDNHQKYTYSTSVLGGQIYNFYLFISGKKVID